MKRFAATILASVIIIAPVLAGQGRKVTASEAKEHVGEPATVCGNVASTHYASSTRGSPTFLNLDTPYPHEIFTIVIWGSDRAKFSSPEVKYRGANVCATGTITSYRGVPEIAAHDPSQLETEK